MSEKILIIDGDPNTLELLRTIFQEEGYTVISARGGNEALQKLDTKKPDLALMDIVMPDMDGYEFLEKAEEKCPIPVVILTAKRDFEDRMRGLSSGAIEYLTKPFERKELIIRIRNILNICSLGLRSTSQALDPQALFLERLSQSEKDLLEPSIKKETKLGYQYPEVAQILELHEIGDEIHILEELAQRGLLDRIFYDVIHLCPQCGHHNLNFREVCPQCESPNLRERRLIEHLSCGYRMPEEILDNPNGGLCPHCSRALGKEGVNYKKCSGYECRECKSNFAEPIVNCRCLNCDQVFDVFKAVKKIIYSYRVTAQTQQSDNLLRQALEEAKIEFLELDFFLRQLNLEIRRSQKHDINTTVMSLRFHNLDVLKERYGITPSLRLMKSILDIINKCLRELDVVGIRTAQELLILLPETHLSMAKILAERIRSYLDRLDYDVGLEMNLASHPQDGQKAEELLEILELGIEKIGDEVF